MREFAKKLGGVSPAHVSDIELGRRFPSDDLLQKMAKEFRVSFDELQSFDLRPPVEELKRAVESDPVYGVLLRRIASHKLSPEEVRKILKKNDKDKNE